MIRVAVVGAGHWGPNLIRNFHDESRSDVTWVIDTNAARIDQLRERYPNARMSPDAGDALSDPQVDAVVVSTPTITHYEIARRALRQDKHVLVEKPVAASCKQANELCDLAESRGRILMVGHTFLYNSAVRWVQKYIEAGDLGRIYYISMVRTNLGPIRMDVNAAWDLASHDISIANHWLGAEPQSAAATGGNWINPGIQDAVFSTLRYSDDVLVHLHASWLNPRKARDITVVGAKRMLTFNDLDITEPIRIYDKKVSDERTQVEFIDSIASFRASVREGDITIPRVTLAEPLKTQCGRFLDHIQDGGRPDSDGRFGAAVVRVLEAMERSMQNAGREERVVL
jgi:predicted dehydrogenase